MENSVNLSDAFDKMNNNNNNSVEFDQVIGMSNDTTYSNKFDEIARVMEVIVRPIYIIFGTIGNLLAFYVMRRGSFKKVSTCFYMSVLALADTGYLWCGAFTAWIGHLTHWRVNPDVWTRCKLGHFLYYFCCQYSSALLVVMCIEKCFALYFPLKVRNICTVKTAKYVTFVTALIFIAFNAQLFFIYDTSTNADGIEYCIIVNAPKGYISTFIQIDTIIYSFAPFAIMCVVNSAIIYKFLKAKCQSRQEGTESTSQALMRTATRGTTMLVALSVTFIILTGPAAITYAITSSPSPMLNGITHILLYLNHGINGILYCVAGSRFRNELMKVLCCKPDDFGEKSTQSTTSVSRNSLKYLTNSTNNTNSATISMDLSTTAAPN